MFVIYVHSTTVFSSYFQHYWGNGTINFTQETIHSLSADVWWILQVMWLNFCYIIFLAPTNMYNFLCYIYAQKGCHTNHNAHVKRKGNDSWCGHVICTIVVFIGAETENVFWIL